MTREQAFGMAWCRLLPGPEIGADPMWWPHFRWAAYVEVQRMAGLIR